VRSHALRERATPQLGAGMGSVFAAQMRATGRTRAWLRTFDEAERARSSDSARRPRGPLFGQHQGGLGRSYGYGAGGLGMRSRPGAYGASHRRLGLGSRAASAAGQRKRTLEGWIELILSPAAA